MTHPHARSRHHRAERVASSLRPAPGRGVRVTRTIQPAPTGSTLPPEIRSQPPRIFLGVPCYGRAIDMGQAAAVEHALLSGQIVARRRVAVSLLAFGFNQLLCEALNGRAPERGGFTHFLLLHSDVVPHGEDWVGDLYRELARHDLGAVAVSIPIKPNTPRAVEQLETSVALDRGDGKVSRVPLRQLEGETFTSRTQGDLLVNTGCLLIDLRHEWSERICFTIDDRIERVDGEFVARVDPEDWNLSRWFRANGVPFGTTTAVRVEHVGQCRWPNWGAIPEDDRVDVQRAREAAAKAAEIAEAPASYDSIALTPVPREE